MITALENAEFEFPREYLEEAYERFQDWTQIESLDDIRLVKGEGYTSWFEKRSDKEDLIAKLTPLGKVLFRTTFRLDK